ncbi:MAG: SPOR domain-containing protein [Spirochaetes bacterium]|nr:SPOR domain-containing protein [Spirochaetota bacterium]
MQNYDFYSGKMTRELPPQFSREDPEYFARIANVSSKEESKKIKRASRILSLIIALCIVSFTTGLIVGIKFAAGSNKEIMDRQTKDAVNDIGHKVKELINERNDSSITSSVNDKKMFSKEEYPYVIKIGKEYTKVKSQEIANIISNNGHTVILSKNDSAYKVFVGPYRNQTDARNALKEISSYRINGDALILKR